MDQLHEQGKNNMATSKLTVSLDSNDKKIFTLMCKDIGFTNPSEVDCDIPEEVDDNDQEERSLIDSGSLAQLDQEKGK